MRYLKLLPPILGVLLTALMSALLDGRITVVETLQILVVVLQAVTVALAGNLPTGLVWPKTALASALAGFQLLLVYAVADGHVSSISLSEWINVIIAVAVAAGVAVIPPRNGVALPAAP